MSKIDTEVVEKKKKTRVLAPPLEPYYDIQNKYEISTDGVGLGTLYGRVYAAACILPKTGFRHEDMKDSKKIKSKKKMREFADYIKTNSIAWHIAYVEEPMIDRINILQAEMLAMHDCIRGVLSKMNFEKSDYKDYMLLVDGNYFKLFTMFDEKNEQICSFRHETIEQGDNKYSGIAAASILAKDARDQYIEDMCTKYPDLITRYSLNTNEGYGTKAHMEGIQKYGITQWHRKSFGCCKTAQLNPL